MIRSTFSSSQTDFLPEEDSKSLDNFVVGSSKTSSTSENRNTPASTLNTVYAENNLEFAPSVLQNEKKNGDKSIIDENSMGDLGGCISNNSNNNNSDNNNNNNNNNNDNDNNNNNNNDNDNDSEKDTTSNNNNNDDNDSDNNTANNSIVFINDNDNDNDDNKNNGLVTKERKDSSKYVEDLADAMNDII
eukprot:Awhi_evm1s4210